MEVCFYGGSKTNALHENTGKLRQNHKSKMDTISHDGNWLLQFSCQFKFSLDSAVIFSLIIAAHPELNVIRGLI